MKKEKTKRNGWKKLLYALVIIVFILVIIFTVVSDFVSYDNPNATQKELTYLQEEFKESDILSSNSIRLSDINTAENELKRVGLTFFTDGNFDENFDLDSHFIPSATFNLNDYEIGALFDRYINSSSSVDNLLSIKELTLTLDQSTAESSIKNYNTQIVLLFNLKSIFKEISSSDVSYLENIYITINTKSYIAPDNQFIILNEREVKINNLNEEKSNKVLKFINGSYSSDSSLNIEKISIDFLKSFINKIISKTNTLLSLSQTDELNGLFTFAIN